MTPHTSQTRVLARGERQKMSGHAFAVGLTLNQPTAGKRIGLASADRPGWFYVTRYEPEHLALLEGVPGVVFTEARIEVPNTLVWAKPDWFDIVYDPHQLAKAPAVTEAALAEVPETVQTAEGVFTVRPYQRVGIAFLRQPVGGILADDVGVGKSAQAILAATTSGYKKVLVAGPLISRGTWRRELHRLTGLDLHGLEGTKGVGLHGPRTGWVFCHYDLLDAWFPYISSFLRPELIILDEAHRLRNRRTRWAHKVKNLVRLASVKSRYVLTGTPVVNHRADYWSLLDAANPGSWGTFHEYGLRYLDGQKTEYSFVYEGMSHPEEFDARISYCVLRREQRDVLTQLPASTRHVIDIDLDPKTREAYEAAEQDIRAYLRASEDDAAGDVAGAHLVQITRLCALLSAAKVPASVDLAKSILESADKIVIFTWYKDAASRIAKALARDEDGDGPAVAVFGPTTGDTPGQVREDRAKRFRLHEGKAVYVTTLRSGSESLNDLVAAHHSLFNDLYWEPTVLLQAQGRLDRSGQEFPTSHTYVRARGTIEDHMLSRLAEKAKEIEAGHGGLGAEQLVSTLGSRTGKTTSALDDLFAVLLSTERTLEVEMESAAE